MQRRMHKCCTDMLAVYSYVDKVFGGHYSGLRLIHLLRMCLDFWKVQTEFVLMLRHGLKIKANSYALLEMNSRVCFDWSVLCLSLCASGDGLIRQCVHWSVWFVKPQWELVCY